MHELSALCTMWEKSLARCKVYKTNEDGDDIKQSFFAVETCKNKVASHIVCQIETIQRSLQLAKR